MKLQKGDIVFVRGNSLISKAIRVVETGSIAPPFNAPSHVAMVIDVIDSTIMLAEANFRGVMVIDMEIYKGCTLWVGRLKEPVDLTNAVVWAKENADIGLKYDYGCILGIVARSFFRLFGKKVYDKVRFVRNLLDSKTRFYCAEFVSIAYSMSGVNLWKHPANITTPWDLARSDMINVRMG